MVFSGAGDGLQLLLVKRKNDPCKGMWAFPGGFVNYDEELEAAAIRELHEETGITIPAMQQLCAADKVDRDPRGRNISIIHYAFADAKDHNPVGADDAAEARWVDVKDIHELAFDHMEILAFAMKTLFHNHL